MPYIKNARRYANDIQVAGELNYRVTELISHYIQYHGLNYQVINDIVGALEGAKLEFYRRIAIPYENNKKNENGDVYPFNGDVELIMKAYNVNKV